eukprot:3806813-Lingulodinium_polyedra.AAC.1
MEVLRTARQQPWSLLQTDIYANLESLASSDEPQEATTWKSWQFPRLQFNRGRVVEGLKLLSDCS